jgi:hypothetical protein
MAPTTATRNRLVSVIESKVVNGIDFVELPAVDSTTLLVHFLNAVQVVPATPAGVQVVATITGGDRIQGITAQAIDNTTDWSTDALGNPVLTVTLSEPGDFSNYTLTLTTNIPRSGGSGIPTSPPGSLEPLTTLDPMYSSTVFSFKVLCPSEFDCAPVSDCCGPDEPPLPAIDYTAKDFQSFKLALSNFSSQRYPSWQERSEADFGVMFMEALCGLADELSYLQDRVAMEATLLTATQRRSLVSMARLVDYEPAPALSSSTTVQCNVLGGTTAVPAGARISATTPDGVVVPFEIGTGLADTAQYVVSSQWNDGIQPYWLDDSQRCLSCGATAMYILGTGFGFDAQIAAGFSLLIQTDLPGESIRQVVQLTGATELTDPIFLNALNQPTPITYITWREADALTRDHDLTGGQTHLAGNLLPATQGQRFTESFAIGAAPAGSAGVPVAIARYGPNGSDSSPNWIFRYPLSRPNAIQRLAWLPSTLVGDAAVDPDVAEPQPEILVNRILPEPLPFAFTTSLLDAAAEEPAFTVDPAAWRVVATDNFGNPTQWEYDGDQGDTIRFGDNTFGASPEPGDVYSVEYRIGLGAAGNVAAGAIRNVDQSAAAYLASVRNPFVVSNGADAETAQHIQRMAPQAFRQVQYRAVRAPDYAAAAKTLPWVLNAGSSFRWTGSWLTVFTTVDPDAGETSGASVTEPEQIELIQLLNRYRLAGYESYAPPPALISIDLVITVCVETGWLASDVEAGVLTRLADATLPDGTPGFFFADSFTFGTPLYRSNLEAAVQGVNGVNGVLDVQYRQRGATNGFQELPAVIQFGADQILRVANDPNFPERGTIRVIADGGR